MPLAYNNGKLRAISPPKVDKIEQITPFLPTQGDLQLLSLAQLVKGGAWQLDLPHDRAESLLIWITRGQGLALLDGARRGVGLHNALFVPARHLLALDLGRQGYGQALVIPPGHGLTLPERPLHLRIRDVAGQSELTVLFEAMGREQNAARPLSQSAIAAYADLAGIWLRRQMIASALPEPRETAARRLMRAYCKRLAHDYASGASMADHAAALNVTPTHLTRVARAETGHTAAELLSDRLVHAARRLLVESDASARDIARHLGFGSAAYFSRFMVQHTGHPPGALRSLARPQT